MSSIFQQFVEQKKRESIPELSENTIVGMHHLFMKAYNSWIPIEEFRKQPIVTILGLLNMISQEMEQMKEEERKLKSRISGRKTLR